MPRDRSVVTSLYRNTDNTLRQNLTDDEMREIILHGKGLLWLDLDSPTPEDMFKLDEVFGFHPLAIEDCQHQSQHPKLDDFGNHFFLVFLVPNPEFSPKTLMEDDAENAEDEEEEEPVREIDIFVGKNYVVTVHKGKLPFMRGLLERGKRTPKRILNKGAAFLLHDILDAGVDQFFVMVDKFQDEAEEAEDQIEEAKDRDFLTGLLALKRRVLNLRRQMSDLRELIQRILRGNFSMVKQDSHIYFRNILDHLHSIEDDLDVCRDTLDHSRDLFLSIANVRSNEVMKVLTAVFTLSLPMTVITGWYGMNFTHLPFAEEPLGVYVFTGIMVTISLTILIIFWRKNWF